MGSSLQSDFFITLDKLTMKTVKPGLSLSKGQKKVWSALKSKMCCINIKALNKKLNASDVADWDLNLNWDSESLQTSFVSPLKLTLPLKNFVGCLGSCHVCWGYRESKADGLVLDPVQGLYFHFLTRNTWRCRYSYSHFAEEKTEAQTGWMTCIRSQKCLSVEPGLETKQDLCSLHHIFYL